MTDNSTDKIYIRGKNDVLEKARVFIYKSGLLRLAASHLWYASSPSTPPQLAVLIYCHHLKKSSLTQTFQPHWPSFSLSNLPDLSHVKAIIPSASVSPIYPWLRYLHILQSQPKGVTSLESPFLTTGCEAISHTIFSCGTHLFTPKAPANL